jgi:hypothetical protein
LFKDGKAGPTTSPEKLARPRRCARPDPAGARIGIGHGTAMCALPPRPQPANNALCRSRSRCAGPATPACLPAAAAAPPRFSLPPPRERGTAHATPSNPTPRRWAALGPERASHCCHRAVHLHRITSSTTCAWPATAVPMELRAMSTPSLQLHGARATAHRTASLTMVQQVLPVHPSTCITCYRLEYGTGAFDVLVQK